MKTTKENITLFGNLITISGIFCIAVALLLLVNYMHLRQTKPLETEAIKSLVQQFQADPESETLKKEIRSLDLLARKAFFTSRWQIRTGAFLLLFGGIAFAAFLRIYHTLKARILEPLIEGTDSSVTRLLSQRWILVTGGILLGSALAASYLTTDYLKIYEDTGAVVQQPPPETGIRVTIVDGAENTQGQGEVKKIEEGIKSGEEIDKKGKEEVKKSEEGVRIAEGSDNVVTPAKTSEATKPGEPISVIPAKKGTATPAAIVSGGSVNPATITYRGIPSQQSELTKNHPSFRGPWGQGVTYQTGIPLDWDGPTGRNIRWKVTLPKRGYNSPVIWGDKLFIAGADNESRVVYCYNRLDGKLQWEHTAGDIPGSPAAAPKVSADTGLSAPSIATDGRHVYAIFATGDIIALDMDGKRIWAKNLGIPDNHYGHSSSLICWKDKVIIQFDTNKGGRLLALNTLTGEPAWDIPRKSKISWSSPMMAEIGGKVQVITTSSPTVAGYDFESGAQLWAIDCLSGEVGPSAAYADGLVYAANEYASLVAIKPGPSPEIVWQSDEYLPEAASPAVSDGLLFIATGYGIFVCYDAKTGIKQWEKEYGQGFYGSPMIAEGRVYIIERSGVMHIFKVDRTLTSLGDPVLGEKSVVTPAFAPGAIYLRGEKGLYCIGQ